MCVLLAKQPGQEIKADVLEACLNTNQDGFGAAWFDGTKVRKTRGLHGLKKILEVEKMIRDHKAIIHFRWTTHGRTCNENCHPFVVGKGTGAFAHNGIFSDAKSYKDWSDTRVIAHYFNQCSEAAIIKNLPKFTKWHGQGNRTAFLLSDGNIYRTGSWQEHEGVQFSNLNWKYSSKAYDYESCENHWANTYNRSEKPKKWTKYRNGKPVYDDDDADYFSQTQYGASGELTMDEKIKQVERLGNSSSYAEEVDAHLKKTTTATEASASARYVETSSGLVALTDSAKGATSSTVIRNGNSGLSTEPSSQTQKVYIEVFGKMDRKGFHHFIVLVDNGRGVKKGSVQHANLKQTVEGWKKCGREVDIKYSDEQTRYQQWLFERQQDESLAACC